MQIFISYASADRALVQPLIDVLRAGGYRCWLDENIIPGTHWKRHIFAVIKESDLFLAAMTENSVESRWCQWELTQAQALYKPVIPVLMQSHVTPPRSIRDIQYVNFTEQTLTAVAQLMYAIRAAESDARHVPTIELDTPVGPDPDDEPPVIEDEYDDAPIQLLDDQEEFEEYDDAPVQIFDDREEFEEDDGEPVLELDDRDQPEAYDDEPALPPPPILDVNDPIYKLNSLLGHVFGPTPYLHFFSNIFDPATISFQSRWKELYAAQIAVFDLTGNPRGTYLDLGIALAMNKPVLLLASDHVKPPALIKSHNLLRYETLDELQNQLETLLADEDFAARLAIKGYCHFCDKLHCEAQSRDRHADRYLVISDQTLLRNPRLKQAERHIAGQDRAAFPRYASTLLGDICDLRKTIHESHFVVGHLDDVKKPETLIILGLAMGSLTPWFILYEDREAVPPTLQQLDLKACLDPEFSLINELNEFLTIVYPDLLPGTSDNLLTRGQTEWEFLESIGGGAFSRPASELEPVLGEIVILRHAGTNQEADLYLHPRTRKLIFGRKNEVGVVPLESQYASRIHFQIARRGDRYFLEDLGSRTGTFLNGERIPTQSAVEIGFGDTITAGRSEFLIWDERERPVRTDQLAGQTADLSGGQQVITIQLDIDPPPDLRKLHNHIVLQAMYTPREAPPTGVAQGTGVFSQETRAFSIESYYPLGDVLKVLIPVLHLPKMTYYFMYNNTLVERDDTPLLLGLAPLDVLQIVPDRVEWTARLVPDRIFHCEQCLAKENGQPKWWSNRDYIPIEKLFERVYHEHYHQPLPSGQPITTIHCPRCTNPIQRGMMVSAKMPGDQ